MEQEASMAITSQLRKECEEKSFLWIGQEEKLNAILHFLKSKGYCI